MGYNGQRQYSLHSVFVGGAWVNGRLGQGGTNPRFGESDKPTTQAD